MGEEKKDSEVETRNEGKHEGDNVEECQKNRDTNLILASDVLPEIIPILPLPHRPIFPRMTLPFMLGGKELLQTARAIWESEHKIGGVVLAREVDEENILESKLYQYGTAVRILKIMPVEEHSLQILCEGVRRFRCVQEVERTPCLRWQVEYFSDPKSKDVEEIKPYILAVISSVKDLLKLNPLFKEQLNMLVAHMNYEDPGQIIDLVASMTSASSEKHQEILETVPLIPRAEKLILMLKEELALSQLQEKIQKSIEEKISKQQKKFFLQEQLKAIKKELGLEKDDKTAEIEKFEKRFSELHPTEKATKAYQDELEKLKLLEPTSPEYHVCRNYLDWMTSLPWGVFSEDNLDVKKAQEILHRDHYGLEDVKDRILEFISTIVLKKSKMSGAILCFVGPPGVGKTSIGRSIAEALNRKFFRFSVGGMHDEAEIKGHRRTYIGAMPGKFIQTLKNIGVTNPVVMLDEIDKIGTSFRGDPASALLEVLDPEQNREFLDHYLDVPFDLSNVFFVTTANQVDTIPSALLDRMEILKLPGYILKEKLEIGRRFLIPRLIEAHGLGDKDVAFDEEALKFIVDRYAREAGVRNFENQLKKILRRITRKHAEGDTGPVLVTQDNVAEYLGQPSFPEEELYNKDIPGVALGLAWTSMGGATLYVEAAATPAKNPGYKQTGQLGKIMEESSEIAYSFIRSKSKKWPELNPDFFDENFIHLHVPAGATPKDGPSAGITMATALYSLVSQKPVRAYVAMTGELTLTGKVLPVGGIKEKVIAARRLKVMEVILPKDNARDHQELPAHLKEGLTCHFVDHFEDVLRVVYGPTH